MQEIFFHIEGDVVIKETHLPGARSFVYKGEPVMDKETFIECYKRWILKEGEEK